VDALFDSGETLVENNAVYFLHPCLMAFVELHVEGTKLFGLGDFSSKEVRMSPSVSKVSSTQLKLQIGGRIFYVHGSLLHYGFGKSGGGYIVFKLYKTILFVAISLQRKKTIFNGGPGT
jgi:hypothetical protein